MRKFPNLREISDEFIMSDLILIVSATILFHICMETSNSVIETGGNTQKPINYLLLLPPYGRLYVDNKLGFGADVLENLEELERLVIKTNSLLYIASPFWILFHQFISIDKINICRGIGIKLFEE